MRGTGHMGEAELHRRQAVDAARRAAEGGDAQ